MVKTVGPFMLKDFAAKMCLCSGIPNGIKQFFPAAIRAIDAGDHCQKEIGNDM